MFLTRILIDSFDNDFTVVPNQVRFTGFRDRPQEERKLRFANGCREGHTEISFAGNGINFQLMFNPNPMMYHHHHHHLTNFERELDFDKEHGKVS